MVISTIASPNPSVYRVDVVRGDQGNTYHVVRCEPVAKFDTEEHAAFWSSGC